MVAKPVPEGQNPRDFQIGQIRRRFSPIESQEANGSTLLRFKLTPSDPDFPFELSSLDCVLSVPSSYPEHAPSLKVKNSEIQMGFALNIERGFDDLVSSRKDATLLVLVNALDRNLEGFLSMEQAKVVKLISNADKRHITNAPVEVISASNLKSNTVERVANTPQVKPDIKTFTAEEKHNAYNQRALRIKQLESRLGRQKLFRKSSDGIAFTLPVEPRMRERLPSSLRGISTVTLYVPLLYPLEPCRAKLEGFPVEDCKPVEIRFEEKARASRDLTLMAHLNFLSQNLYALALPLPETDEEKPVRTDVIRAESPVSLPKAAFGPIPDGDRSHVIHIPRPPEWDLLDSSDYDDSDDDEDGDDDDETSSEHSKESTDFEPSGVEPPEPESPEITHNTQVERGTAISFPHIELFGIELFEISILNLTVKCERCKEHMEATSLRDGVAKNAVCKKCSTPLVFSEFPLFQLILQQKLNLVKLLEKR